MGLVLGVFWVAKVLCWYGALSRWLCGAPATASAVAEEVAAVRVSAAAGVVTEADAAAAAVAAVATLDLAAA